MSGALVLATVAAKRLGVSSRTIRTWIRNGDIAGVHVGRFWYVGRESLESLIAKSKERAPIGARALARSICG